MVWSSGMVRRFRLRTLYAGAEEKYRKHRGFIADGILRGAIEPQVFPPKPVLLIVSERLSAAQNDQRDFRRNTKANRRAHRSKAAIDINGSHPAAGGVCLRSNFRGLRVGLT